MWEKGKSIRILVIGMELQIYMYLTKIYIHNKLINFMKI